MNEKIPRFSDGEQEGFLPTFIILFYHKGRNLSMRLQNIDIDPSTMLLQIDIMEQKGSFAVVVCDGKAKLTSIAGAWRNEDHYTPRKSEEG